MGKAVQFSTVPLAATPSGNVPDAQFVGFAASATAVSDAGQRFDRSMSNLLAEGSVNALFVSPVVAMSARPLDSFEASFPKSKAGAEPLPAGVKHPSALPEASTPAAASPAPQFVPLAASAVAVDALPVTLPVILPLKVPVVVPGNVGFVGMDNVNEPLFVIGDAPVTVIWFDVPTTPTDVTVPAPATVPHVLSPRRKVVLSAVPEPRRAGGTVPDASDEALSDVSPAPLPVGVT